MPDELKEIPQSGLQQLTGRLGQGMQKIGRTVEEAITPLQQTHPIRSALSNLLISSPLQSAGAALQDWSGTPRDISEDYPYRARLFDPKQPAMVDPRILDVSQFAGPVVSRARNAVQFAIPDLKAAAIAAYGPQATAAHVIKPKGGNWVPEGFEATLNALKRPLLSPAQLERIQRLVPGGIDNTEDYISRGTALNNWIDTKLNHYFRNEMATPEDPVRALAERNILHFEPSIHDAPWLYENPGALTRRRRAAGYPKEGLAQTPLGQSWELLADQSIKSKPVSRVIAPFQKRNLPVPDWMLKLEPTTPFHYDDLEHNVLGFTHLVDELRNALDPNSTLPRDLRLTPEQLSKVTVPQAVERVAKINAWREAQRVEANAALAMNPATVLHREYPTIPGTDLPNERGLRWVEMQLPESRDVIKGHSKSGKKAYKELQDALEYEGDIMRHCVGGPDYCEGVISGQKRIYSLRDAKGQPHVTIEVRPNSILPRWDDVRPYLSAAEEEAKKLPNGYTDEDIGNIAAEMAKKAMPPEIFQIKGKGNRKPNEEYLPFVQDFVQSGQWSDVGDIHNAEMFKLPDNRFVTRKRVEEAIARLSNEDSRKIGADWFVNQISSDPSWWNAVKPAFDEPTSVPRQYRKGGLIQNPTLDAMQINAWNKSLHRQDGGTSEPTQAEIEAAMRPETVSPRLRALASKVKTQPGMPITDRLVGAGEAATSLASGILGSIPAGYEGMAELLRSRDPARAAQAVETGLQRYTYQPRTTAGAQEAQAGAHLLEKLDAPSQYVGDFVLEQTGSPGAATAAKIALDPLNFLPGPKQLASTVRGVPQMLQEAAIQAYGPGATASHIVPPQGNINLVPQIAAETLKGPNRQPLGNFLRQAQGMPGVTKEGLAEGLAATKILDPTAIVTKAEFEKYITPSKYEKVDLLAQADIPENLLNQFHMQAFDHIQQQPPYESFGGPLGVPASYAQDFNTLVDMVGMPGLRGDYALSDLVEHGASPELISMLERSGMRTIDNFDSQLEAILHYTADDMAADMFREYEAGHGTERSYERTQRLISDSDILELPEHAYQEIGITHPSQNKPYKHYAAGQKDLVGHFRGTMVPKDFQQGIEIIDGGGVVPPGAFLIEEIQSDAQKAGDMSKHLHQVHGTVAKAAIQHALEQGARTIYIPTSSIVAHARGISDPRTMEMLRRVYDKEVPSQAIEPLRKIPGITITKANPVPSATPGKPDFLFHVITVDDSARNRILSGAGQSTPGYAGGGVITKAKGGPVTNDAMWMAVQNKQLRKKHGN